MAESLTEPGDTVRVVSSPYGGMRGTVKRVVKMPGEHSSAAVLLIKFPNGDESYQAGNNWRRWRLRRTAGRSERH
jgi:hypothetical protein